MESIPSLGGERIPCMHSRLRPIYALKMYPGGVNTFGGPRRNEKGQIVRPDGSVIHGLYGAGKMGSVLGFLYSGGGWNICECVVSGRLAADNAVMEEGE